MRRKTIACKVACCVLTLFMVSGIASLLRVGPTVSGDTVVIYTVGDLKTALENSPGVHSALIMNDITVKCPAATEGNTAYFKIKKDFTLMADNDSVTIKREAASSADNGSLQSLFGIEGNGKYDGVNVTFRNVTIDGGADFGNTGIYDRVNLTANDVGAAGRSIIDVYGKATLNIENGVTIKNGFCTCNLPVAGEYIPANYGGGIRIECNDEKGGGTVNLKAGSSIVDCSVKGNTSGYGGGIGGYSFSRINIYGGTVKNCSAYYGGGIACTYRGGHSRSDAGVFKVYGGTFYDCHAFRGGAISADGNGAVKNAIYGGSIDHCGAADRGGAVCLGGNNDGIPALSLAENITNGPLNINSCKDKESTDPDTKYKGVKLGHKAMYLGDSDSPVTIERNILCVSFKRSQSDNGYMTELFFKNGSTIGAGVPAFPEFSYPSFKDWNTAIDGSGTVVDKNTKVTTNFIAYGRWAVTPTFEKSDDVIMTYGETGRSVAILNAGTPYGAKIRYQWYEGYNGGGPELKQIEGATSSSYSIPSISAGVHYYTCLVTADMGDSLQRSAYSSRFKVGVTQRPVKINWGDTKLTYNGKEQLPKAVLQDVFTGDDCSVKVIGAATDVGTYVATAKLVGKDAANYDIASGYDSCEFTIKSVPTATPTPKPDPTAAVTPKTDPKVSVTPGPVKPGTVTPAPGSKTTVTPKPNPTVSVTPGPDKPGTVTPTKTPSKKPTSSPTKGPQVALTLDKQSLAVVCGKSASLTATLKNSKSKIIWTSSDPKIATVDASGKVTAKMAGAVTITASAAGKSVGCNVTVLYKDVTNSKDFWYEPTNYLTAKGVVKGYDKQTLFKPANKCTRAQMVTFIWRLMGEPEAKTTTCKFSDVKKTDYFYKACIWGNEKHIVEGYKDGTFGPQIVCARRHAVTFLWRLAGQPSAKTSANRFTDVKKSDYFYKATLWASEKGILAGYSDGTFRPDGDCLRRQMVTFLYKYDKFVNEKG